jgi:hypothetical protein
MKNITGYVAITSLLILIALILTSCSDKPLDTSDNLTLKDIPDIISINNDNMESLVSVKFGDSDIKDSLKVTATKKDVEKIYEITKNIIINDTISSYGLIDIGSDKASCAGCSHFQYMGDSKYYMETESEYVRITASGISRIYKIEDNGI